MDVQDPQYRTTDGSALRMWRSEAQNNYLSEQHGRPIFDEVIYVEVISPGSRDSSPVFELVRKFAPEANRDVPKFGAKYEQFKEFVASFEKSEQSDASLAGTPLNQWPEISRSRAASLKAQNIFTVDALANLPDSKLASVGPDGRTWREKAKAFIENAKGNAYATALAAELDTTKGDLAAAREQIEQLANQVATLQASIKPFDHDGNGAPGGAPPPPTEAPAKVDPKAAAKSII